MTVNIAAAPAGTQSIARAAQLLRLICAHPARGARLVDIAGDAQLTQPTVRRILKGLADEGLVMQDQASRRYRIGPLAFELGLASHRQADLIARCRPAMQRLAEATGDTIYLTMRSGFDGVCLERVVGPYPIKAMILDVGGRRPLGAGAGGLAMLAALPNDEVDEIVDRNAARFGRYNGLDAADVRAAVRRTRRDGYALSAGLLTPGVSGIGLTIPSPSGPPVAALSVAAVSDRIEGARQKQIVTLMRREIATIASSPET